MLHGVPMDAFAWMRIAHEIKGPPVGSPSHTKLFSSILAGYMCDRFSTRPVHFAAAVSVVAGSLMMVTAHRVDMVLISGAIIGIGIGLFLTANWTLANELAPHEEAGKFLGLTNLATAGAGALSRLFGPVIDNLNLAHPGSYQGYAVLFMSSAVFAVLGYLLLENVYRRRVQPAAVK